MGDNKLPPQDSITYSDMDSQMGDFTRRVELNERVLQKSQQFQLMLLDAVSLPALLDVLLFTSAKHFALNSVELWLYDPGGAVAELLPEDLDYAKRLQLLQDSSSMQELYGDDPQVRILARADLPQREVLEGQRGIKTVVLLPLVRNGSLVGSLHWGTTEQQLFDGTIEVEFIRHLAAMIAICYENCVNQERLSQLSLLDPLTRISNDRAFGMELRKEISRSQRSNKALTLLSICVDDFKEITDHYGHLSGDFALKMVARSIAASLRTTDHIARCGPEMFAVILPGCSEVKGQEIAERMRSETEFMEIDDGRGANLYASLSIGITSWNPKHYPAINMEQLAGQLQTTSQQALSRSRDAGGNRASVARLTTMIV